MDTSLTIYILHVLPHIYVFFAVLFSISLLATIYLGLMRHICPLDYKDLRTSYKKRNSLLYDLLDPDLTLVITIVLALLLSFMPDNDVLTEMIKASNN